MKNISDLENVPKRLLEGDGLKRNKINFKMDAEPDREPVEIKALCSFFDVCVMYTIE